MAIPPQVIRFWDERSDDYHGLKVFFTKEFYESGLLNTRPLESFPFFQPGATHVFPIDDDAYFRLTLIFKIMRDKLSLPHTGMENILRNYLKILFLEIETLYGTIEKPFEDTAKGRGYVLLDEFKKLVALNYLKERSVSAYANMLFITPTHLSNTIKEISGNTPTEIIEEMILLDAKVMLSQTNKPVNEIADHLGFNDPSYFSKFFKKRGGMSPAAFRAANRK